MALSIGFRIISFLPSCYSSYGALDSYPGGTLTHCSCQPSLDAHFPFLIAKLIILTVGDYASSESPRVKHDSSARELRGLQDTTAGMRVTSVLMEHFGWIERQRATGRTISGGD